MSESSMVRGYAREKWGEVPPPFLVKGRQIGGFFERCTASFQYLDPK
jgi:hypothetical protein